MDRPFARIEGISARRLLRSAPPPNGTPRRRGGQKNGRCCSSRDKELRRALNGCKIRLEMGEVLHVGIDHVDAVGEDKRVGPLPGRKPRLENLVAVVPVEGFLQRLT